MHERISIVVIILYYVNTTVYPLQEHHFQRFQD